MATTSAFGKRAVPVPPTKGSGAAATPKGSAPTYNSPTRALNSYASPNSQSQAQTNQNFNRFASPSPSSPNTTTNGSPMAMSTASNAQDGRISPSIPAKPVVKQRPRSGVITPSTTSNSTDSIPQHLILSTLELNTLADEHLMSKNEIDALQLLFMEMDVDNDGVISMSDLIRYKYGSRKPIAAPVEEKTETQVEKNSVAPSWTPSSTPSSVTPNALSNTNHMPSTTHSTLNPSTDAQNSTNSISKISPATASSPAVVPPPSNNSPPTTSATTANTSPRVFHGRPVRKENVSPSQAPSSAPSTPNTTSTPNKTIVSPRNSVSSPSDTNTAVSPRNSNSLVASYLAAAAASSSSPNSSPRTNNTSPTPCKVSVGQETGANNSIRSVSPSPASPRVLEQTNGNTSPSATLNTAKQPEVAPMTAPGRLFVGRPVRPEVASAPAPNPKVGFNGPNKQEPPKPSLTPVAQQAPKVEPKKPTNFGDVSRPSTEAQRATSPTTVQVRQHVPTQVHSTPTSPVVASAAPKRTHIGSRPPAPAVVHSSDQVSGHTRMATAPIISSVSQPAAVPSAASNSTSSIATGTRVRASGRTNKIGSETMVIHVAEVHDDEESVEGAMEEIGNMISSLVSSTDSDCDETSSSDDSESEVSESTLPSDSEDAAKKEIGKMISQLISDSEGEEGVAKAKPKQTKKKLQKEEIVDSDDEDAISKNGAKPAPKKVGLSFRHLDMDALAKQAGSDSSDDDALLAQYWGDEADNDKGGAGGAKKSSSNTTFAGLKKKLATSAQNIKTKLTQPK